ncbi:MAG TPA: lysine--tRNA ligase [Candidatus Polarisedimenticolaceae bacterium]|nr:lysine--tRNA ligase [Candidatus Polarisedimenticolaceae bacterium]
MASETRSIDGAVTTRHWADEIADAVRGSGPPVISTGISPSGEIHIGNMREVLTADAVFRALRDQGVDARFNYVADNFDPLRRVYPFLDAETYAPLVGRPLSEIVCPCGEHASYSEHFLRPFLAALDELGVTVEVERADEMYKSGRMSPYIIRALERRDQIATILSELTGKRVDDDWSPFNPLCPDCDRITQAKVDGFDVVKRLVHYSCACGARGSVPMAGGGKLVWRIDWPARWILLGVTVEPFGKDHASDGGSYDTGVRIVREVFGGEPPYPVPYEWIRLKGQGDMSSSRGNVLSIGAMLEVVPPEALRYLVIRERPTRAINFDPGLPLLQLVDELDDVEARGRNERAVELSRAGEFAAVGVPFKHLVVVAQSARFDAESVLAALRRSGYGELDREAVETRLAYARRWLERFAPEEIRFVVAERLPAEASALTPPQRRFLATLADRIEGMSEGKRIHEIIYDLAPSVDGATSGELFEAIYLALLGKRRGPRAGLFIASIGWEFCAARFREAAAAVVPGGV